MPARLHTHTTDTLDTLCPLRPLSERTEGVEVLLQGPDTALFGQREASDIGASKRHARCTCARGAQAAQRTPPCTPESPLAVHTDRWAKDKAHVASTASVELFGVILPRAAAAPVAMYATHRISSKCSPDASAAVCFTRLGHMHLIYVRRASYVTCCGAVNPRPPRGRSAAPDSWRAPRGPPHAAPTPRFAG